MTLSPFHDTGLFLCLLKASENLFFNNRKPLFSDAFQGVQKETSAMKLPKHIFNKCLLNVDIHACSVTVYILTIDLHWFFECIQEV